MGDKGEYIKTVWGMGYKFGGRRMKKPKEKIKKIHSLRQSDHSILYRSAVFIHSDYYRDQRSLS